MKKTISLILCVAMLVSSLSFCFPAFALEMDFGVESAENYATTTEDSIGEAAEAVTLAAAPKAGDPGINIWTGTTEAFNFDGLTTENLGMAAEMDTQRANEKVRISDKAMYKTESVNSFIDFNGKGWPHFAPVTNGVSIESSRPVEVSFDYRAAAETTIRLVRNCDNMTTPTLKDMILSAASTWTNYTVAVKGTDAGVNPSNGGKPITTHPGAWQDDTTNIKNIIFIYTSSPSPDVDFDNVSARPYYKVTFYDADGTTVLYTAYVDPDETTYNIPASAALDTNRYDGYALKGTTEIVTSAALANKDIEFVAQLKAGAVQYKKGDPGINVFTGDRTSYGFENPNYQHMYTDTRPHGVVDDPANAANKVLWFGAVLYSNISLTPAPLTETDKFYPIQFDVVPENDRPFTFSMDVKSTVNNAAIELYSGLDNSKLHNPNGWVPLHQFTGITTSYQPVSTTITYSQMCRYGFPLLALMNSNAEAAANNIQLYVDNMKLVPYYKVTFYAADGETVLHTEYVAPETVTYAIPAVASSKLDAARYNGYALKGTTDVVTEVTLENQDLEFVAQLKPGAVEYKLGNPGINLWTGSPAPYDFENDDATSFGTKFYPVGNTSFEVKESATDADNKAVKLGEAFPHFSIRALDGPVIDKERPILVSYDYIAPVGAKLQFIRNAINTANKSVLKEVTTSSDTTSWTTYTTTVLGTSVAITNAGGAGYVDNTQDIRHIWFLQSNTGKDVYMDNISLVPYYKATYYDYDGTSVIKTEYVAPNAESMALSTLDTSIYEGYALKGTTDVITSASLSYEDLEFVAILKDGIETTSPVSYTGYDNKTTDVDYRYPGVSYTFDEEINDTTLAGISAIAGAKGYELSADKKVLTVYPDASVVLPGGTLKFAKTSVTTVMTQSGKAVVFPEVTLKYADVVKAYDNLVPAGDMEGAYLPFGINTADSNQVNNTDIKKETLDERDVLAVRYKGTGTNKVWASIETPVAFEEGATYKIYADVKLLGGKPDGLTPGTLFNNLVFADSTTARNDNTLAATDAWTNYEREFKPAGLTNVQEYISFFANPADNTGFTEYAIDNFEVYKRVEVKFEGNDFAPLKAVAEAPTVEGKYAYVKGGTKNPDAKITLPTASDYYEARDARRSVSGWLGSNGEFYADGAEVDLAETYAITFQPNLVAAPGYKFITVKFEGDVTTLPATINGALEGDTIDLTKYYNIDASAQAKAEGKRFNGWSINGGNTAYDIVETLEIANDLADSNDEIIVTAVVNYDYNFAIPANHGTWTPGGRITIKYEDDMLKWTHASGSDHDINTWPSNLSVPAGRVSKITFFLDANYSTYAASAHAATDVPNPHTIEVGDTFIERLYFEYSPTTSATGANTLKAPAIEAVYDLDNDSKADIAKASFNVNNVEFGAWDSSKILTVTRFDVLTENAAIGSTHYANMNIRYVAFEGYATYDKNVSITDLEIPVTGNKPDTAATASAGNVKSIEWANLSESGTFKESTQYEVTVKLEPEAGKRYADDTEFTLAGATATSTVINNETTGEAVVIFKFDEATSPYKTFEFDLSTLTDIEVTSIDPIQLEVNVTDADADVDTSIVWSITGGADVAEVTEDGALTVFKAGTITLKALSAYNENKSAEKTINITLADSVKSVEVSFAGDIESAPATVTRLAGTVLDITEYYNVTANSAAAAEGKIFNGWTPTGKLADLITTSEWTIPEEDTTLHAVVNYDINLAIPANAAKLKHSRGTVAFDETKEMAFADHTAGQTYGRETDFFIEFASYAPMVDFKGFEAYLANEFIAYADNNKSSSTTKKFTDLRETSYFYFSNVGGYHYLTPVAALVTGADGVEYAKYTVIANTNANWINGNKTTYMRLDPMDTIVAGAYVRYLRYIPYDVYEGDIEITFDAPETGKAPATVEANGIAAIKSFTVTPDLPAESGLYEGLTVYTATVVIEPADKANYRFKDDVKVLFGTTELTNVTVAADGTVTAVVDFPATEDYIDFDIVVDSEAFDGDVLVTDGTPVQFTAEIVYANDGDQLTTEELFWSVDDTNVASIDENGLLTPMSAGTVTVNAQSKYNLAAVGHKTVNVELAEGLDTVEISFAGDLETVPAAITRISGTVLDITEFYNVTANSVATAEAKRFNGWSTTGELADLITTNEWIIPEEDTTLYAIVNHDVNFAIPANMAGLDLSRSTASYEDGVVFVEYKKGWTSASGNPADIYIAYPSAKAPMSMYRGMEFYFLDDYTTFGNNNKDGAAAAKLSNRTDGEAFYFSSTGGYHYVTPTISKVEGADGVDYAVFTAITNGHANWIEGNLTNYIRLDPMTAYADFRIRYLRFVPYEVVEGDIEITADAPATGMAVSDNATVNNIGVVTEIAVTPENFVTYTYNGNVVNTYVANETYTVRYTVKPADSAACFSDSVTATVNGLDAVITLSDSKTTAYVEYTFPATEAYTPIAVSITGPSEILTKGRATQYRAVTTAPDGSAVNLPTTSVTWSVASGDESYAIINSETGMLVPVRNAYDGLAKEYVTVVATSNYDGTTVATYNVQLKNQAADAVVNYNLMGGVPAAGGTTLDPTVGAGSVQLAASTSVVREGYEFVGWATSDESAETVDVLTLTVEDDQNTSTTEIIEYTVYAVWQKIAFGWEFNSQAEVDSFVVADQAGTVKQYNAEGYIEFDITASQGDTYRYVRQNIDATKAKTISTRIMPLTKEENINFYFSANSVDGDVPVGTFAAHVVVYKVQPNVWNETRVDLSGNAMWHDTVTQFRYDFINNRTDGSMRIDYIRFLEDYVTVTFDANAGSDTVTGLPAEALVKFGGKVTPAEVPTRDGYIFAGWSKSADGSTAVKKEFGIVSDVTLYAIWEESNTTVEADGSIAVGAIDPATDEVLLVKTDAGATVTLVGDGGTPLMTETADSDGYARFDLTTLSAPVTNATVQTDAGSTLESATVTDEETADTITSVPETGNTGVAGDDDDDTSSSGGSAPSMKVETVTKPGTIDPSTMYPEEETEEEGGEEEFQFNGYSVVNTDELPYVDVTSSDWFYGEVASAYKLGFIKGKSVFTYDPNGDVTIAEAITFALRLNYGYYGKEMPEIATEGDWYTPIVEAALEAGIIKKAQFTEYDVPALRKQVAAIMAKSVPSDYLGTKNMFASIPDVNKNAPEYSAIIKLYRAGVLIGSDAQFNFMPETHITRAEMAAIINRIAIPENRKRIVTPEEIEARRQTFTAEDIVKEATAGNCYSDKLALKGGYATATGKSADPIIYLTNLVPELDGASTSVIRIGLKTDALPAPQLFFTVPGGGWAADRMLSGTKGEDKGNGVVEYVFDPKSNTQFANTITGLRFDPFNAKDIEFAIAYVIVE